MNTVQNSNIVKYYYNLFFLLYPHKKNSLVMAKLDFLLPLYIYIYAFSRRFYPKRLTVHSGYTCIVSMSSGIVPLLQFFKSHNLSEIIQETFIIMITVNNMPNILWKQNFCGIIICGILL